MSSVKISELNVLNVVTSDDFLPLVDSGSGTTYRVTFNTLNGWMSTNAYCLSSSWASSSISSSNTITSSYAITASSAVYAWTASYAKTASYFNFAGLNADTATSASFAKTASCLQGNGTSWEKYLQVSGSLRVSGSGWISIARKRDVQNESSTQNSIFFHDEYGSDVGSNDWSRIYFTEDVLDAGRMVFEHGDNIDPLVSKGADLDFISKNTPGFLWQTYQTSGPYATGSLMFLQTSGKLYTREVNARNFTASCEPTTVGFYGTASWAQNIVGGIGVANVPVGTIVDFAGASLSDTNWAICDGSEIDGATYSTLAALLGTGGSSLWGAASAGKIKLPDFRQKISIGAIGAMSYPSSYISGSVGNTGGSDGICHHHHLIGKTAQGIDSNGGTNNDDLMLHWINNQSYNLNNSFPHSNAPGGSTHAYYLLTGDNTDGRPQPNGSIVADASGNTSGWIVCTSYAIVSGSKTNAGVPPLPYKSTAGDLMLPYGVCHKIIRIQ